MSEDTRLLCVELLRRRMAENLDQRQMLLDQVRFLQEEHAAWAEMLAELTVPEVVAPLALTSAA